MVPCPVAIKKSQGTRQSHLRLFEELFGLSCRPIFKKLPRMQPEGGRNKRCRRELSAAGDMLDDLFSIDGKRERPAKCRNRQGAFLSLQAHKARSAKSLLFNPSSLLKFL